VIKLTDFKYTQYYLFHIIIDSTNKNKDGFCTDITFLINGILFVFIMVKKPNNIEGIIAKHKKMKVRSENRKLRSFINTIQIMAFSIDMEYDGNDMMPIQAIYYTQYNYCHDLLLSIFMNEWAVIK
jgi:type I restriction enzyme R subunit